MLCCYDGFTVSDPLLFSIALDSQQVCYENALPCTCCNVAEQVTVFKLDYHPTMLPITSISTRNHLGSINLIHYWLFTICNFRKKPVYFIAILATSAVILTVQVSDQQRWLDGHWVYGLLNQAFWGCSPGMVLTNLSGDSPMHESVRTMTTMVKSMDHRAKLLGFVYWLFHWRLDVLGKITEPLWDSGFLSVKWA